MSDVNALRLRIAELTKADKQDQDARMARAKELRVARNMLAMETAQAYVVLVSEHEQDPDDDRRASMYGASSEIETREFGLRIKFDEKSNAVRLEYRMDDCDSKVELYLPVESHTFISLVVEEQQGKERVRIRYLIRTFKTIDEARTELSFVNADPKA